MECLSKLFFTARDAASELGTWCSDEIWKYALNNEEEVNKIKRKLEWKFNSRKEAPSMHMLESDLIRVQAAAEMAIKFPFKTPTLSRDDISPKVECLNGYLSKIFERPTESRCIVFVKKRYTAVKLAALFKWIGTRYCKVAALIGSRAAEAGDMKVTFREQVLTLHRFRKGEVNCLFATSIAEEGLDIPDCNTIIRFDLYNTVIQYIQSRGRARHVNSKYIHMVEEGNVDHMQLLHDVHKGERLMRQFCEALPADRKLKGNDFDLDEALAKHRSQRSFVEPSTGAKLTYGSSLTVLANFVDRLPKEDEFERQATYIMTTDNQHYLCEVVLPGNSPIKSAVGRPASQKANAKRSAAFEACLQLRKRAYLDKHLLPIYDKQLPAMRNAHLALNVKKTNAYDMRAKPLIWEQTRGCIPTKLFVTIFQLEESGELGRPYEPLAMLTRTQIPNFPPIDLHLQPGKTSKVLCIGSSSTFNPTTQELDSLTTFTLRIFKDIFNKIYEVDQPHMSYWLAPVTKTQIGDVPNSLAPGSRIDWELLAFVERTDEMTWTMETPHGDLANRFLVDRWDGGRRFFSIGVVPELHARDPVPDGSPAHKYMDNILDYTVSLFSKSRARATFKEDQPVIKAHRVLHRRNWLDEWDEKEEAAKTLSYVCPEPLRISAVSIRNPLQDTKY